MVYTSLFGTTQDVLEKWNRGALAVEANAPTTSSLALTGAKTALNASLVPPAGSRARQTLAHDTDVLAGSEFLSEP